MNYTLRCMALFLGALSAGAQGNTIQLNSDSLPKIKVDLDLSHKMAITLPSDVIRIMPRCRSGRCYGLFALDPAHSFDTQIGYFDTSGNSFPIKLSQITDLKYITVLDLAPTDDGVIALLQALVKPSSSFSASTPKGSSKAADWFLAKFNQAGELKGLTQLQLDFQPQRLAALQQGRLVVTGFDSAKGTALLATLRDDGTQLRRLSDDGVLPQNDQLLGAATLKLDGIADAGTKAIAIGNALSGFQFGYAGDEVLLLCGTNDGTSVLSIKGSVTERVKLRMPVGVVASTLIPTDYGWLVRALISKSDTRVLLECRSDDRRSDETVRVLGCATHQHHLSRQRHLLRLVVKGRASLSGE